MKTALGKKGLVFAGTVIAMTGAFAADATIGVDFASSYVSRGATLNEDPVAQPYFEVSGMEIAGRGITFGTWANYDFNNAVGQGGEISEIDYYASIDLGAGFYAGYIHYTYPTGDCDADKEFNVGYGTEIGGVALGITGYATVSGPADEKIYIEACADYGIEVSESFDINLGATLAYQAQGPKGTDAEGFSNYTLSAGCAYQLFESTSVTATARYIGQMDDEVQDVDKEFVGILGVAYTF